MKLVFIVTKAGNTLDNKIILSQSSRLIEATNVNFTSQRNPVRFSAENLLLHQLDNGVVNCNRELHREFGRYDICND